MIFVLFQKIRMPCRSWSRVSLIRNQFEFRRNMKIAQEALLASGFQGEGELRWFIPFIRFKFNLMFHHKRTVDINKQTILILCPSLQPISLTQSSDQPAYYMLIKKPTFNFYKVTFHCFDYY